SETGGKAAKQVGSETEGKAAEQVPPPTPVDPEMGGKAKQVPPPPVVEVAGKAVGEQVPPPIAVATEARVGDPMLVDQVQDPSKGNSASKDPAEVEAISSEEEGANLKGAFKDASVDILQAQRKVRDALKNLQEQPSHPAREETVAPPATKKRKKESEKPTSDQVKIPVEEEQLFVPGADEKGVL
ncbi:unnamed protein product, partial [Durusdinium trenchii]